MKWIEVQIKTTTEAVEAVTNILYEVGVGGIVIEDPKDIILHHKDETAWDYVDANLLDQAFEGVIVKGYLEESEDLIDKVDMIKQNIEKIPQYNLDKGLGEVTTSEIEDQDWSSTWKKHYKPKRISERIVVKPSWETYDKQENDLIIELDPGMAFGTGTHETTIMCVQQLEKYVHTHDVVFDVGCGTGILAIAAAKLGAFKTVGIDLDPDSVKIARENTRINGVSNRVDIRHGDLLNVVEGKANVVVANIIAPIIKILSSDIPKILEDDGVFIASGIILEKTEEVKEALRQNGLEVLEVITMGEWRCIVSKLKEGEKDA